MAEEPTVDIGRWTVAKSARPSNQLQAVLVNRVNLGPCVRGKVTFSQHQTI